MLPKPINQNHNQQYRQPYSIFSFIINKSQINKDSHNQA